MVWRRLEVCKATTLQELHGVIQVAMGWESVHLFLFALRAADYGHHMVASRNGTLRDHFELWYPGMAEPSADTCETLAA